MASALSRTDAEKMIEELSELTLPLMWTLRQEAMRAFEALGVRPVKALLLELVERGLHPKDLAEVLDTVPPAISAMLSELESQGLLKRRTDPEDRRRVQLQLTDKGRALRLDLKEAWYKAGLARLGRLSREELASLIAIYKKLLEEE